uniref:Putative secreted protein n=1 Tax=Ixodes ricinus TaxID=34613 RepID=A0A6B0U9U9_IXORI
MSLALLVCLLCLPPCLRQLPLQLRLRLADLGLELEQLLHLQPRALIVAQLGLQLLPLVHHRVQLLLQVLHLGPEGRLRLPAWLQQPG